MTGETGKPSEEGAALTSSGLRPVYFDYDKSLLRTDALKTMANNIIGLKANPKLKVRIEGNRDERGTAEYNQALGQRRSANARTYLAAGGISANRIALISYGKGKPSVLNTPTHAGRRTGETILSQCKNNGTICTAW